MARVTIEHTRAVGYCRKGVRAFLQRHGLSWRQFLYEGIDEERLLATGDAMATRAVEYMRGIRGKQ